MEISTSRRPARSLQARLVDRIRTMILSGELRPGDPVPEIHMARRLRVSQASIREALLRLEHAGLVRRVLNVGTFVTQLSPRDIRERLRLRVLLEGLACEDAARRVGPADHEEIEVRLAAIRAGVAANDHFATAQADLEFHRWIWMRSGDETLYQCLDQITVPLFAFVSLERYRRGERLLGAVQAHEPIGEALKRNDPGAAREAIREHIESSYAEFLGGVPFRESPEPGR